MYLATVCLAGCGGCEASLLSVGEPFVALLSENSISFSSLLVDGRAPAPADVVLASGAILNTLESELAAEVGRMSRKVIALGSCAVYGGIGGLSRAPSDREDTVFQDLPEVAGTARPLDSAIPVELYIPGCPPPPRIIFDTLKAVVEGRQPQRYDSTVCSDCDRTVSRAAVPLGLHPGPGIDAESCLLSGGLLCAGPVTRGGCGASCPSVGAVCAGCRGPSDSVLSSQLHSQFSDMLNFLSRTQGTRPEKLEKQLASMLKVLYMFTAGDPVCGSRVRGRASLA